MTKKIAAIRAKTSYDTVEEFEDGYIENFDDRGLFIPTRQVKDIGTRLRFELQLRDGTPVFRGEGLVTEVRPPLTASPGMRLRFTRLDRKSKTIFEAVKAEKARAESEAAPKPQEAADPIETPLDVLLGEDVDPTGREDFRNMFADPPKLTDDDITDVLPAPPTDSNSAAFETQQRAELAAFEADVEGDPDEGPYSKPDRLAETEASSNFYAPVDDNPFDHSSAAEALFEDSQSRTQREGFDRDSESDGPTESATLGDLNLARASFKLDNDPEDPGIDLMETPLFDNPPDDGDEILYLGDDVFVSEPSASHVPQHVQPPVSDAVFVPPEQGAGQFTGPTDTGKLELEKRPKRPPTYPSNRAPEPPKPTKKESGRFRFFKKK
jgi:uncharacterized protein (TIGR02266 family)